MGGSFGRCLLYSICRARVVRVRRQLLHLITTKYPEIGTIYPSKPLKSPILAVLGTFGHFKTELCDLGSQKGVLQEAPF